MGSATSTTFNAEATTILQHSTKALPNGAPVTSGIDIASAKHLVEASPDSGLTLLLDAAEHGDCLTVSALIEARVPVAGCDANGHNALHRACFSGHEEIAKALIAADAMCVHATSVLGNTPLHAAVFVGNERLISMLLHAHADPTGGNGLADGAIDQPIHLAVAANMPAVVESLLAGGASASAVGLGGNTPLHVLALVHTDELRICEVLLKHGALHRDDRARNCQGKTAKELARFVGHWRLAARLEQSEHANAGAQPQPPMQRRIVDSMSDAAPPASATSPTTAAPADSGLGGPAVAMAGERAQPPSAPVDVFSRALDVMQGASFRRAAAAFHTGHAADVGARATASPGA